MFANVFNKKSEKRAQASLEFCVAIIIMTVFLVGIVRIWEWGVEEQYMRQKKFEITRVRALKSSDPEPNFSRSKTEMPALTDKWVFKGEYYR